MATEHITHFVDAAKMEQLENGSVNLVVTSPPYPMVQMWDDIFAKSDPEITKLLAEGNGWGAFEKMHQIMDEIWAECHRVTSDGGFVCINIGDATRTIGGEFALYTNRARIDTKMVELGFTPLPSIIWQKVSNSATAFMGSGMLPAGAYVAHGHEHILIYRKGGKRQFKSAEEKQHRRESAFFWEERNVWFSDVWNFTGTRQKSNKGVERERSAAYPFELPFRLIAMYSVKGDTVLDPFMGTGSTHAAAIALQRNSVGYEIDPSLKATIGETKEAAVEWGRQRQQQRLDDHKAFVIAREASGKVVKHFNENHQMKVMTSQEKELEIELPKGKWF
jgi:DNA modification methylase